jgi:hypothetical protein
MKPAHGISSAEPEGSPAAAGGPGHFYLWFPLRHTLSLVLRELGAARREPRVLPGGDGLIVALDGHDVESFASRIAQVLSPEETAGTRVLWVAGHREPGLADFQRVSSLGQFRRPPEQQPGQDADEGKTPF